MRTSLRTGLLALAGLLLLPTDALAQEPGPPAPPAERRDSVDLRAEREVFEYPEFERRNPFKALTGTEGGPRFEQMKLTGVIFSDVPARSVATLTTGGSSGGGSQAGRSARLRAGERWGNVRVVSIRQDRIVVDVEEFGLAERREMLLPTRGQGGSR